MKARPSLKDVERKAFASRFEDGLVDIVVGGMLLNFAMFPLVVAGFGKHTGTLAYFAGWLVVGTVALILWKCFVAPRKGVVVFGQARRRTVFRSLLLLVFLGLVGVALSAISFLVELGGAWTGMSRLGLMLLLGSCIAAYFFEIERFYYYGMMLGAAPLAGEALHVWAGLPYDGIPLVFGMFSGAIILTGISHLMRFIRNHPIAGGQQQTGDTTDE